jgi:chromate transporter
MKEAQIEGEFKVSTFTRFKEVALLFLKLGLTAWGGPAVSEAMMHDEAVHRRKWLDDQRFLDILGVTNLIPGPNAVELSMHLGLIYAGWPGFLSSGLLFVIPGFVIAIFLAWIYKTYGSLPQVVGVLYGIKPVVIAIIIQAVMRLGKRASRSVLLVIVGLVALGLYLIGVEEMFLLFGGALVVILVRSVRTLVGKGITALLPVFSLFRLSFPSFDAIIQPFSNITFFLACVKIGALLFGSGYVLLAFAKTEIVENLGWITNAQLIDAIAVGQAIPGPLTKSLAFIGYLLGGLPGAIASLGIYLPSLLLVALISHIVILVRKTWWAAAFIDGVTVASLGLMAGAAIDIGRAALVDIFSTILALASLLLIFKYKVKTHWIILGGGIMGIAYKLLIG